MLRGVNMLVLLPLSLLSNFLSLFSSRLLLIHIMCYFFAVCSLCHSFITAGLMRCLLYRRC